MKKNILYIRYPSISYTLYDDLNALDVYNLELITHYDELLLGYKKDHYELVIIHINNIEEKNLAIFHILQQKTIQHVLIVLDNEISCFFEQQCRLCQENYFHKSILVPSSIEKIIPYIEDYKNMQCDFTQCDFRPKI